MTPEHCAALLRRGDPDRFASTMAAEPRDRARLATLYAANLEIARAAIASAEPLISQMRLQWWADQIARMAGGHAPAAHEIASPLFDAWGAAIAPLGDIVEARHRDALREPFTDEAAVLAHIDACTGTLMRLAAGACGLDGQDGLIADQARGAGLAAWLGAYPRLRTLNLGLAGDSPAALGWLAQSGLSGLDHARTHSPRPPRRAAPALFAGAGARAALCAARHGKQAGISEFRRKLSYAALAGFGRWQG
ncbi:MAG: squalene/phytoene synthase family protein [Paracoccus sp. (in: a-proteobacteria)]|nr:squalene/phytoene synthase family protein [Paracoccus sp. (in: a-proteobacteria)]